MSTDERDQEQQLADPCASLLDGGRDTDLVGAELAGVDGAGADLADAELAELVDRAEREPSPPAARGAAFGAAAGAALGVVAFGLTENPVWLTSGLALGTAGGVLIGTFRDRRGY